MVRPGLTSFAAAERSPKGEAYMRNAFSRYLSHDFGQRPNVVIRVNQEPTRVREQVRSRPLVCRDVPGI
jgi:hypothetical protein